MKAKSFFGFVSIFCVIFLTSPFLCAEQQTKGSPSAYFPPDQYEFEMVLEGTDVTHDLVLKNAGNAPLEVKEVGAD